MKLAALILLLVFFANSTKNCISAEGPVMSPSRESKTAITSATQPHLPLINLGNPNLTGPIFDAQDRAWIGDMDAPRPPNLIAHIKTLRKNRSRKPVILPGVTPLLWDRQNRLWLIGNNSAMLEGLDFSKGEQIRRLSLTPEVRNALLHNKSSDGFFLRRPSSQRKESWEQDYAPSGATLGSKQLPIGHAFRTVAFESYKGDLFFADTLGIHVLTGSQWSYKITFERSYQGSHSPNALDMPLHFAEDKAGRVYMWTENWRDSDENTKGFWVWERSNWRQIKHVPHVLAVAPRAEGVWVFSRAGELFLWKKDQWSSGGSARHLLYSPLIWKKSEFRFVLPDGTIVFWATDAISRIADETVGDAKERPRGQTTVLCLPPRGPVHDLGAKLLIRLPTSPMANDARPADFGAKLWTVGPYGIWIFDTSPQNRKNPEQFYAASLENLGYLYPRAISKTGQLFFVGHASLWHTELSQLRRMKPSEPQLNTGKNPPWPQ